jgi:hypothetical protein
LDQFDYPAKGDSIPPPKLKDEDLAYLQEQQHQKQLEQNNNAYGARGVPGMQQSSQQQQQNHE